MAQVKTTAIVNLQITDGEWKLIMKALAAFSGVWIKPSKQEKAEAEKLNRSLLGQRRADLQEQLTVANGAYAHAEETYDLANAVSAIDGETHVQNGTDSQEK